MKLAIADARVPGVAEFLALAPPRLPKPAAGSPPMAGVEGSLASLVSYIVDRHHAYTRSELQRLVALVSTIGALDTALPGVQAVVDAFAALESELRAHMTKEEAVVFPYIVSLEAQRVMGRSLVRSPFGVLRRPLKVMFDEQCQTRSLLESMRRLSNGYTLPPGAPTANTTLYQGLEGLERDLCEHGWLETEVLFPRALELEQRALG